MSQPAMALFQTLGKLLGGYAGEGGESEHLQHEFTDLHRRHRATHLYPLSNERIAGLKKLRIASCSDILERNECAGEGTVGFEIPSEVIGHRGWSCMFWCIF